MRRLGEVLMLVRLALLTVLVVIVVVPALS